MLRSELLFISAVLLLLLSPWAMPRVASAGSNISCSMVNGTYTCTDTASSSLASMCNVVNGVYVCSDGSIGSTGTNCVSDSDGNQACVNGSGSVTNSTALGNGLGVVANAATSAAGSGWLSKLTHWGSSSITTFFAGLAGLLKDLVMYLIAQVLALVAVVVAAIPVPDWLTGNSLGTLLGQTGAITGYFMSVLNVPAGLALLGGGYTFRLLRKFLTLFQW